MAGNQHNDWGHSDVGQNKRDSEDSSGSTSSAGINTNFQHANPESNVNPPGAPQNSHGSATGPLPGGVEGQYQASQNAQAGMGASAAGGNPGTTMGNPDASDKGIHGAGPDGGAPAGNGSRQG